MGDIGSGGIVALYLPAGGTAGQALVKNDGDNYDVTWGAGGGGGGGIALSAAGSSAGGGTVVLSNSNGVSFGMNGQTITASVGGAAAGSIVAGVLTLALGQAVFSNSNGVSFGLNGSTMTASHNGLTTAALSDHSHGNPTLNLTNLAGTTASNSAGFTLSLSATAQSVQTQNSVQVQGSSGNISFDNANGITFGGNASTITASHNGLTSQSNQAFSAAGGSSAFQTLNFRNANGFSFSNSGGFVEGSYSVPAVPPETPFGLSAGTQSVSTGTLAFANSNGISFGMSGSSQITASHNGLTTARASNDAIGLNSAVSNATLTANSAGLSFDGRGYAGTGTAATNASITLNSNGLSISVAAPGGGGGNFSAGLSNLGNSAGATGITGTRLVLVGTNNITLSQANDANGATISISGGAGGGGADGFNILAAGTQTATSAGSVLFENSNGITFGMSGSTRVTASHNGLTTAAQSNQVVNSLNGSTGQISLNVGSSLSASTNGSSITFGLASNITTALQSAGAYLTTAAQSNQVINSLNGSTGQISLNVGSSLSASTNGSSITFGLASNITTALQSAGAYLTSQSNQNVTAANGGFAFQTLSFSNLNGISFGTSAGSAITASHNALTSQSNQAVSGQNGSSTFQTLSFGNSNGISFGTAAGGITASHNGLTTARASNDGIGTNTAQTNVTWTVNSAGLSLNASGYAGIGTSATNASITLNSLGLAISVAAGGGGGATSAGAFAVSNTTLSSSGTLPLSQLSFAGAGIASVGVSNGSIIVSVPSGGGAGDGFLSFGMSTNGNTAGTSGLVTSGRAVMVGTGIISLSQSVNGQSLSLSIGAPDTMSLVVAGQLTSASAGSTITLGVAGDRTLSGFHPYVDLPMVAGQVGQGTLQFEPEEFPNFQFDRILLPINYSGASNSTATLSASFYVGVYSRSLSSLSLITSLSSSTTLGHSGTAAGSWTLHSGMRLFSMPLTSTFTAGDYWLGFGSRTSTSSANVSLSNIMVSNLNSNFVGIFGASHNTTIQFTLGQGVYTATTLVPPDSVAFSQIRGSDSNALRAPIIMFASGTV